MTGIYKITNILDGKYYVGRTTEHEKRWKRHLNTLRSGKHPNTKFQNAWNYWGEQSFVFEVVECLDGRPSVELKSREDHYLTICQQDPNTNYNLNYRSDCGVLSDDAREKIRTCHRGSEWCRKIGEANRKRKLSEHTRQKISRSLTGKPSPKSAEHRRKISVALTGMKRPPMSLEHRQRLSDVRRGTTRSPETRLKMRAAALRREENKRLAVQKREPAAAPASIIPATGSLRSPRSNLRNSNTPDRVS